MKIDFKQILKKYCKTREGLRVILILFCIGLGSQNIFAQKDYLKFSGGINLPLGSQTINGFQGFINERNQKETISQVDLSLGRGYDANVTYGHYFSDYIAMEVSASYLFGTKQQASFDIPTYREYQYYSSRFLRVSPSLLISTKPKLLTPYGRFGVTMGSGSIFYEYDRPFPRSPTLNYIYKLNGNIGFGFTSGVGVNMVYSNLRLFAEFDFTNFSYSPTKGEVIFIEVANRDILDDLTVNEKEIEFVNSYTEEEINNRKEDEPALEIKESYAFGSFGFKLGLIVYL